MNRPRSQEIPHLLLNQEVHYCPPLDSILSHMAPAWITYALVLCYAVLSCAAEDCNERNSCPNNPTQSLIDSVFQNSEQGKVRGPTQ
jgi:hypothetical protein